MTPSIEKPKYQPPPPMKIVNGIPYPDTSYLITENNSSMVRIFTQKQQRLLTEALYSSWTAPDEQPFLALCNVGLFFEYAESPLVPDVMLSLNVKPVEDITAHDNRSYFVWIIGKVPEVVIEIVSDRRGGEEDEKRETYARLKIPHYVIFDPEEHLDGGVLRVHTLQRRKYKLQESGWMPDAGLGVKLWEGTYAGLTHTWLRWCDEQGEVILTGQELGMKEHLRAEAEQQRAEKAEERVRVLEERLRQLGANANGKE